MTTTDASLLLFLDLGDVLTKGTALLRGRRRRLRFPSAVARRLLREGQQSADLLLDSHKSLQRLADFDPDSYPRTRSYPGGEALLGEVHSGHRLSGARFAGWLAAAYGADRQLLGSHPSAENVDALVRRALVLCAEGCSEAEVVFVVDAGAKAAEVQRYAEATPRTATIKTWSMLSSKPHTIQLSVRANVVDAADCAVAAVPPEVSLERVGKLLVLDIGYLRTKLTIVSSEGCEHQEQLSGLGVSDCVRRILRDGQDQGLVEDELAVIKALEQSRDTLVVAGRRFDIRAIVASATQALEQELAKAAQRALKDHFGRRGEACLALAVIGGGAALIGRGLADRLTSEAGLEVSWVATDTSFLLVDGARRRQRAN